MLERKYHLNDFFDHERQSENYENSKERFRKRFVIEYCDDQSKLDRLGLLREFGGLEAEDVYHQRIYEELPEDKYRNAFDGIAWEHYLFLLFNPKVVSVKFWEELLDENGKIVQERWLKPPCTFHHEFAKKVNRDITVAYDATRKETEALTKELELYKSFVKKYNAEQTFKEYKEEADER